MAEVTVIIVNYNSGDRIVACVKGLLAQSFDDFRAVVVDNASRDDSIQRLKDSGLLGDKRLQLVENADNLGFAAANNQIALTATTPWIATLNPDAIPAGDWLEKLMEASRRYPLATMFGSLQLSSDDPQVVDGYGDVYHASGIVWRGEYGNSIGLLPRADAEVFAPCAAAALYQTAAFQAVGGYDERFFCCMEDVDIAFRLRHAGGICVQVREAIVYHEGSAIIGKKSAFGTYYGFRNRLWTYVKNMPCYLLVLTLPVHVLLTLLVARQARKQGFGEDAGKGLRDALAGLSDIWRSRREILRGSVHRGWSGQLGWLGQFSWSPFAMLERRGKYRKV
jgi:GT2 family glycosyltransferase